MQQKFKSIYRLVKSAFGLLSQKILKQKNQQQQENKKYIKENFGFGEYNNLILIEHKQQQFTTINNSNLFRSQSVDSLISVFVQRLY
uniref:Uncharacterized protein n=1 Tax=Meloidogyne enterolobii TaxID=390850 RepID=A0A6V7TLQ8_MELEN|nr:unnamed protein product [Meloidogyne enterolobii]